MRPWIRTTEPPPKESEQPPKEVVKPFVALSKQQLQHKIKEDTSFNDDRLSQFKKREGLKEFVEAKIYDLNNDLGDLMLNDFEDRMNSDNMGMTFAAANAADYDLDPDVILKAKAVDIGDYELMK